MNDQSMTPEQRAELRAIARREAAKFPPLTPEQLARVAALLRPAAQQEKEAS
jgi:hypothetical protein